MPFTSRKHRYGAAIAGFALVGLSACGGASAAKSAAPQDTTTMPPMPTTAVTAAPASGPAVATSSVAISNFAFGPAVITIKAGTTVTWTNKDEEPHTVTFNQLGTRSPNLTGTAVTYSQSFSTPGSYDYHCSIHPFMHGTVIVTA
jgi:amicyanin